MFENVNKSQRWILSVMIPIIFCFVLIFCYTVVEIGVRNKIYAEFGYVETGQKIIVAGSKEAILRVKAKNKVNQVKSLIVIVFS